MSIFLAIQNTYDELQIALLRETHLIDSRSVSKMKASAIFIDTLQELLIANSITFNALSFIAVNQGPGPFTTLRTVISSVNGLSFATNIPLVGIDGLKSFAHEYTNSKYPNTVILLNAFNYDVYFAIQSNDTLQTGYNNIDTLLEELKTTFANQTVRFLGNGTQMYQEKINALFANAYIPEPIPLYGSIEQIGILGWQEWQRKQTDITQLMPLYLKKHEVQR